MGGQAPPRGVVVLSSTCGCRRSSADVALAQPHRDATVEHLHHRHRVDLAAVHAADRDGAAAAYGLDRGAQRRQSGRWPSCRSPAWPPCRAARRPPCRRLAERRPVGLHADRVDHAVGAAAVGHLDDRLGDVVDVVEVESPRRRAGRAISSRSGTRSTPITRQPRVPRSGRPAARPGRARARRACRPRGTSANCTACQAVGRMSERKRYRSSGTPSGTLIGPNCACGTRRYSACPPGTEP